VREEARGKGYIERGEVEERQAKEGS